MLNGHQNKKLYYVAENHSSIKLRISPNLLGEETQRGLFARRDSSRCLECRMLRGDVPYISMTRSLGRPYNAAGTIS
jgi:hypothetical protein